MQVQPYTTAARRVENGDDDKLIVKPHKFFNGWTTLLRMNVGQNISENIMKYYFCVDYCESSSTITHISG